MLLRLLSQAKPQDVQAAVEILIRGLDAAEVAGKLWTIRGESFWSIDRYQQTHLTEKFP